MLRVTLRDKLKNQKVRKRTTVMTSVATIVAQNKLRRVWSCFKEKEGGHGKAGMGGVGEEKEKQWSPVKKVEGWVK